VKLELLKDPRSEARLIGGVMFSPDIAPDALDFVAASDFTVPVHATIWRALTAMQSRGDALTTHGLLAELDASARLQERDLETVLDVTGEMVPSGAVEGLAKHVRRVAAVRAHQERMLRLLSESQEPIEDLERFTDRVEAAFSGGGRSLTPDPVRLNVLMSEVMESLTRQAQLGERVGFATGLRDLDNVLGGLVPGEMSVVAGRPGMGKSALAQRLALGCEQSSRRPVLIVSLEMSRLLLGRRLLAADARVDGNQIRNARLSREQFESLERSADSLAARRVYVLDGKDCSTMLDVRRAARRVAVLEKQAPALIAIDYAQIVKAAERYGNREQEVASISAAAVRLSKEMDAHVMLLAQINRECERRTDKRPMLSDLRESGSIEQDADAVIFVYRDEYYDSESQERGIAELIVAKNRSGPTGTVKTRFDGASTSFENLYLEA
jgi:replicative DNA helicase